MTLSRFDFLNPQRASGDGSLASDMEKSLDDWLRGTVSLVSKKWCKNLVIPVELHYRESQPLRAHDGLARLSDSAIGYRIPFPDQMGCLVAMSRPVVLAIIGGVMGESCSTLPEDRELTAVEESLCDYLFQDLLIPSLSETWPGASSLGLGIPHKEPNPKWSRAFLPDDIIVACSFTIRGSFGEHYWQWLLPRDVVLQGLGPGQSISSPDQEAARPSQVQALVGDLRVELSVVLGTAELSLTQLSRLRVGDLVLLDQYITEPLTARVGQTDKFRGWPGRVGLRQAYQIDSLIET